MAFPTGGFPKLRYKTDNINNQKINVAKKREFDSKNIISFSMIEENKANNTFSKLLKRSSKKVKDSEDYKAEINLTDINKPLASTKKFRKRIKKIK